MSVRAISVLIPVYNAGATLDATLESVARQTLRVDEVVVVDDGSTDDTLAVIERWTGQLPITVHRHERNQGLSQSLRDAAERASGALLFRVDGDDAWAPDHVERLAALAEERPQAVLFTSRAEVRDDAGAVVRTTPPLATLDVRRALMWDNPLLHSAVCFRRAAYAEAGGYGYSPQLRTPLTRFLLRRTRHPDMACDYGLWIRLMRLGDLAACDEVTVRYLEGDRSLSRMPRSEAIAIRFAHQREALAAFWRRAPLRALVCLLGGLANLAGSVLRDALAGAGGRG